MAQWNLTRAGRARREGQRCDYARVLGALT